MAGQQSMSVEHGALGAHVNALRENHQKLMEQSSRFLEAIEPLRGVWKGSSFGSWDTMTQNWKECMDQVNSALNELLGRADVVHKEYQSGEEEQAQTLSQRLAGMDMPSGNIL